MSKIKLVPYNQLRGLNFESFIGSKINTELYQDIRCINKTSMWDDRFRDFSQKYNLKYLGEVLERYEERGIVKTKEDLRTLLVFTVQSIHFESPDINTNQLDVFISKVEKISLDEKDIFNIGVLLQSDSWVKKIVDDKKLCNTILDELENNDSLSFEEKVWGMYSCWNYVKSNKEFKGGNLLERVGGPEETCEKLLQVLSGIELEPLKYIEDYYLYLMLAEIASEESFFAKSKNFKKKSVCNQYKKLLSLVKKEYTRDTVKSLVPILGIDEDDLLCYNYLLSEYSRYIHIDSKVTSKGSLRLCQAMLYALCKEEKCPTIILSEIRDKIYSISQENDPERRRSYYTYTKGKEKATEIVFENFSGKISKENFDVFLSLTGAKIEDYMFMVSQSFYYLLEDDYEEQFNKISFYSKERLIESCIRNSKDKSLVERAFSLYNQLEDASDLSVQQLKNLYSLEIIDAKTDYKYTTTVRFEGYLLYLQDVLSEAEYLDELKSFYSNINDIESRVFGYIGKTSFVSDFNGVIMSVLRGLKIQEIAEKDLELARKYQEFKDNLFLVIYDVEDYYEYLIGCLKKDEYKELMCLSDDDVTMVSRAIYESLKEMFDINQARYGIRRIYAELEGMVLTEAEKEAKERAMLENKIQKELNDLKKTRRIYNFDSALESDFAEEESFVLSVKDIFIKKVKEENIIDGTYEIGRGYAVIDKLVKKGKINDNELLEFAKVCLKAV